MPSLAQPGNIPSVPPRIFPGPWNLDKLPAWLTIPAGILAGAFAGYRIARTEHTMADIALLVALVIVILWSGLTAPRAIPARSRRSNLERRR